MHAARATGLLDLAVCSAHVEQPEDGEGDRNRYQDVVYDGSRFLLGGSRFFFGGSRFFFGGSRFFVGIRCLEIHLSIYRFGAGASSMMVLVME